jgi:hypothetical protein
MRVDYSTWFIYSRTCNAAMTGCHEGKYGARHVLPVHVTQRATPTHVRHKSVASWMVWQNGFIRGQSPYTTLTDVSAPLQHPCPCTHPNSIKQSPSWEADDQSASQEIPRFLLNQDSLPCSQEPATGSYPETEASYLPKISSNINLLFTPTSCKWCLPFRFSNQNFVYISHLPHASYMFRASHPPPFGEAYK